MKNLLIHILTIILDYLKVKDEGFHPSLQALSEAKELNEWMLVAPSYLTSRLVLCSLAGFKFLIQTRMDYTEKVWSDLPFIFGRCFISPNEFIDTLRIKFGITEPPINISDITALRKGAVASCDLQGNVFRVFIYPDEVLVQNKEAVVLKQAWLTIDEIEALPNKTDALKVLLNYIKVDHCHHRI